MADLQAIVRSYVDRMLEAVPGMKVLLLDAETTAIVSCVYSQSQILEKEVYLVQRVDDERREPLKHLKCIAFLRPTRSSVGALRRELRAPRFSSYALHFSNTLDDLRLQDLAEVDEEERVESVHEDFVDFIALDGGWGFLVPVDDRAAALGAVPPGAGRLGARGVEASAEATARMALGVASVALGLRRRFDVRYQRGASGATGGASSLAEALHALFSGPERELYDFGEREGHHHAGAGGGGTGGASGAGGLAGAVGGGSISSRLGGLSLGGLTLGGGGGDGSAPGGLGSGGGGGRTANGSHGGGGGGAGRAGLNSSAFAAEASAPGVDATGAAPEGTSARPLVLVLDRLEDPISPLLIPWTYEALMTELLGAHLGRIDLRRVPGIKAGFEDVVVGGGPHADPFFAARRHSNYGEASAAAADAAAALRDSQILPRRGRGGAASGVGGRAADGSAPAGAAGLAAAGAAPSANAFADGSLASGADAAGVPPDVSLADLAAAVEDLPARARAEASAYKHVTILGELAREIERRDLLRVSEAEQELAAGPGSASGHGDLVRALMGDRALEPGDRARLLALFALRYGRDSPEQVLRARDAAVAGGVPQALLDLVGNAVALAGPERRVSDLFSDRGLGARFQQLARVRLRGIDNALERHVPAIKTTLEKALRGRLPEADFPAPPGASHDASGAGARAPHLIVAFFPGGATLAESRAVAEINAKAARGEDGLPTGARVLLGGTGILTAPAFLDLVGGRSDR